MISNALPLRFVAVLLALALSVRTVREARADTPQEHPAVPSLTTSARARYEAGSEMLRQKRYAEAALQFEAAATLHPHAASWYMASIAWGEAFRPDRAADALVRALAAEGLDAATRTRAEKQLAELESALGTLQVSAPPGWRVQLDNASQTETPARLHALPGARQLRILPPAHAAFEREVVLGAGVANELVLSESDTEERAEPRADGRPQIVERVVVRTEPPHGQLQRTIGVGLVGLAVATATAAAIFGVSALDARDAYRISRTQQAYDHVRYLQTWTNVAWTSAAVFAAAGVTLLVWPVPSRAPAGAGAAPAGVGVSLGGAY